MKRLHHALFGHLMIEDGRTLLPYTPRASASANTQQPANFWADKSISKTSTHVLTTHSTMQLYRILCMRQCAPRRLLNPCPAQVMRIELRKTTMRT